MQTSHCEQIKGNRAAVGELAFCSPALPFTIMKTRIYAPWTQSDLHKEFLCLE